MKDTKGRLWLFTGGINKATDNKCPVASDNLTCAAMGTLAVEGRYSIMAGGPAATSCIGTVINVFAAVLARPAVDTDTVVAAVGIVAGASILTGVWHQLTLINIFCAVLACKGIKKMDHQVPMDGSRWVTTYTQMQPYLSSPENTGSCTCSRHPRRCRRSCTGFPDSRQYFPHSFDQKIL